MLDFLLLFSILCIWLLLFINIILIFAGYQYYIYCEKKEFQIIKKFPKISILIPAHNESKVIVKTIISLLNLNYPHQQYEIIVINDNSSDDSAQLLAEIQRKNPHRRFTVINTNDKTGGKGKSNALNIGFAQSDGKYIVIYDADNTPEKNALLYLVSEIEQNNSLGAVIGKFRTRNKDVNLLTRFINIETLSFQWMAQAGRWQLFKLCTIPGTNFIIRRSIIEAIGGWDEKAISEDTEISFRIYLMGYYIKFLPNAVTWEQEPQTIKVWFLQRTRWVKGNIYVLIKNFPLIFSKNAKRVRFDLLYFSSIYFLLLTSLVLSDILLFFNLIGWYHSQIAGLSNFVWFMAILLFALGTFLSLTTEKGELSLSNFLIIFVMYATYCKMWLIVAIYGLILYIRDILLKKDAKWYKTQRF